MFISKFNSGGTISFGVKAKDLGNNTVKWLESRSDGAEGEHLTVREEAEKTRNDNYLIFQQLMQSMQSMQVQFVELTQGNFSPSTSMSPTREATKHDPPLVIDAEQAKQLKQMLHRLWYTKRRMG